MPNAVNTNSLSLTYLDFSGEKSTTQVNVKQLTDNATYALAVSELESSIGDIALGTLAQRVESLPTRVSNVLPAQGANRETKWLVRYEDNTTKKIFNVSIPCANSAGVPMLAGTDYMDLSQNPNDQFVTNFQAIVASPDGNAVTVLDVRLVGRNI